MSSDDDESGQSSNELAHKRTDFAEDRTVLAIERTFASWMRTGVAAAAIGLGFQALFVRMDPWWAPRAIASVFFLLSLFVFVAADLRACKVLARLSAHQVKPFDNSNLRAMTVLASVGVIALMIAMWFLPISR